MRLYLTKKVAGYGFVRERTHTLWCIFTTNKLFVVENANPQ